MSGRPVHAFSVTAAAAVMGVAASSACGTHGDATGTVDAGSDGSAATDARTNGEVQDDGGACMLEGSLGPTCDPCVATHCCLEHHACFSTAECIDVNDCTATCDESVADSGPDAGDCPTACKARYPEAAPHFEAWDQCVTTSCATECPR